jgi:hypothetical protein
MTAAAAPFNLRQEWLACLAMASQAYRKRVALGSNWFSGLLIVLALGVPLVAGTLTGRWKPSILLGTFPFVLFCLLWWCLLVASIVEQNFPTGYYLVPRLRVRSLAVLGVTALALVAVHTLLFAMLGVNASVSAALTALVLATMLAAMTVPTVQLLVLVLAFGQNLLEPLISVAVEEWVIQHHVLAVMLVILSYGLLGWWHGARAITPLRSTAAVEGGSGGLYSRKLRRDCARSDIGALLIHSAGPAAQAVLWSAPVLLMFVAAGLARAFLHEDSSWIVVLPFVAMAFTILAHYFMAQRVVTDMLAAQRAQGLLRLAARAPQAAAFNGVLARSLLWDFGLFWVASSACVLLFLATGGMDGVRLLEMAAVCVMDLMVAAMLLRDYADGRPDSFMTNIVAGCYLLAAHVTMVVVLTGRVGLRGGVLFLVAAGCVSAAVLVIRFRRMALLPVAFPAGRLR